MQLSSYIATILFNYNLIFKCMQMCSNHGKSLNTPGMYLCGTRVVWHHTWPFVISHVAILHVVVSQVFYMPRSMMISYTSG